MDRPTCKTCRWWDKAEPQFVYGDCRRLPPTTDFTATFVKDERFGRDRVEVSRWRHGTWPNVNENDWCGEHAQTEGR